MPFAHPPLSRSAVIAQLRAAGCVFAEDEAELLFAAPFTPAELAAAVERRVEGFPLEHILGWAEFCGLRIVVEPGVFVPRRRTELLVREAAALLRTKSAVPAAAAPPFGVAGTSADHRVERLRGAAGGHSNGTFAAGLSGATPAGPTGSRSDIPPSASSARRSALPFAGGLDSGEGAVVLDLCCGSGAVGTALAALVTGIELHASDVDPVAVRCAERNVDPVCGSVYEGDLYSALPARIRGNIDILAVNAPYVPTESISSMPHEARAHEPTVSLDGGADGLDIHRKVAAEALAWLRPGGHLLIETSRRQAKLTATAVARGGLTPRIVRSEELDGTVVIGRRPLL
jgi:release factor glutamine methyltransferase